MKCGSRLAREWTRFSGACAVLVERRRRGANEGLESTAPTALQQCQEPLHTLRCRVVPVSCPGLFSVLCGSAVLSCPVLSCPVHSVLLLFSISSFVVVRSISLNTPRRPKCNPTRYPTMATIKVYISSVSSSTAVSASTVLQSGYWSQS